MLRLQMSGRERPFILRSARQYERYQIRTVANRM